MWLRRKVRDSLPEPLRRLARQGRHAAGDFTLRLLAALGLQRRALGRAPDLVHPRFFTDKVRWRMLYDRRPLLEMCSDRLATRDYVAALAGEKYLVPLLGVFERPEEIPWGELSPPYVVKATHGQGWNIFVQAPEEVDPEGFRQTLAGWLKSNFYYVNWEWSYKRVPRRIMVERFIGLDGQIPEDFKFYCFEGGTRAIAICNDRFTPAERFTLRDPSWDILTRFHRKYPADPTPPPSRLGEMVELAGVLSRAFDFVRVDLYCVGDRVYFGELTPTPSGGTLIFSDENETWLGEPWHLPTRAAVKKRAPSTHTSGRRD